MLATSAKENKYVQISTRPRHGAPAPADREKHVGQRWTTVVRWLGVPPGEGLHLSRRRHHHPEEGRPGEGHPEVEQTRHHAPPVVGSDAAWP